MPDADAHDQIFAEAASLAEDLHGLQSAVFPTTVEPFQVKITAGDPPAAFVRQVPTGTVLASGGVPLLRVVIEFG